MKAGAALAVVAPRQRAQFPADAPLLVVDDVLAGLRDLARAARARSHAQVIARHRLGRQDLRPRRRCAARSAREGETHASAASYNNHWGVPLSLARCPATRAVMRCSRSA